MLKTIYIYYNKEYGLIKVYNKIKKVAMFMIYSRIIENDIV